MASEDWTSEQRNRVWDLLTKVWDERKAQVIKWGPQSHPDGTSLNDGDDRQRDFDRHECQAAFADGTGTWRHILQEEVSEAFAEVEPSKLINELVQVAAVCLSWVEDIYGRA